MQTYQHPLTHESVVQANWRPWTEMGYPTYQYQDEQSFTNLTLSYQDDQYRLVDGNPLLDKVYFEGKLSTMDGLFDLLQIHSGNARMQTEIGRELQDSKKIISAVWEDEEGVFVPTASMYWLRFSKVEGKYLVEVDRNRAGFDNPTDQFGPFDSLDEAIQVTKKF